MDIKFKKSKESIGPNITITNDPDAVTVRLDEEDIRERYPREFSILTTRFRKRYKDF